MEIELKFDHTYSVTSVYYRPKSYYKKYLFGLIKIFKEYEWEQIRCDNYLEGLECFIENYPLLILNYNWNKKVQQDIENKFKTTDDIWVYQLLNKVQAKLLHDENINNRK